MRYLIVKQTDCGLNHACFSQSVECNSHDDEIVVPGENTFIAEKREKSGKAPIWKKMVYGFIKNLPRQLVQLAVRNS